MNKHNSKRLPYLISALCFSLLFFLTISAEKLSKNGNILWTGSLLVRLLLISLLAGSLLGVLATRFLILEKGEDNNPGESVRPFPLVGPVSFLLMALSWLPIYLAYYPGICAYDSYIQVIQIFSGEYTDHHPILHTLLIKACLNLGHALTGSYNTGMGLYSLLQLLALAAACAYGIAAASRHLAKTGRGKASRNLSVVLTLLFMVCPFQAYMAVSVTKDIPFTICMILMLTAFSEILFQMRTEWKPGGKDLVFFLSALGCIIMRNNGKYALLVPVFFLICALIRDRKKEVRALWGRLLTLSLCALVAGTLLLSAAFRQVSAVSGDKREMLSLPIQQLARVMIYHGGAGVLPEDDNTLDQESRDLINDFLTDGSYRYYKASISDPVKRHTNTSVARYQAVRFVKTYLRLLVRYPGDYFNAFLGLYAGFFDPLDETHAAVNLSDTETGLGYVQTRWQELDLNPYGIYKASLWPALHEKAEKWAAANEYLQLPILKYLLMPGIWLWGYMLLFLKGLYSDRKKYLLPLAFVAGYYLTMLLGPTVQLRYIFPCMVAFPFLAVYIFRNSNS